MSEDYIKHYIKIVKGLLKAQKETEALLIFNINNINSYINNHDNWNGGIDYYTIEIGVSPSEYTNLKNENKIEELESCIELAFKDATKGVESIVFDRILIVANDNIEEDEIIEAIEDFTFWNFGYYKMFISHLSMDKSSASNLKTALVIYGISCFVAHEDIEPTKEWASEIEKALLTMDCLCAIITTDFIKSKWCDQEVGFALGRRVLVIPIRKGYDPYGLMGKYQGVQSNGKNANKLAKEIFDILCKNTRSKNIYTKNLGNFFLNSKSTDEANKWIDVLNEVNLIEKDIVEFINTHYLNNDNLKDSNVIEKANKLFTKHSLRTINKNMFTEKSITIDNLPF
ncbi:MAG: toll/interleukin-1 receptor domain-containing protein [Prolixibacteraceae bacterium]|jgi:hypothetical protein|nr:toll/interleukin-1 receptor domain-containing protein [Prolixibacteraceae bacterium]